MKRNIILLTTIVFIFLSCCSNAGDIREPAVAGMFYPENPDALKTTIDRFFGNVPEQKIEGKLIGLIAPHAGYVYSGQVAGYAFKELQGKSFDTVVVIGPSHRVYLDGASVYNGDFYLTPLGKVKIDKSLAKKIISENDAIKFSPLVHKEEHSVEVEIPFLQKVLKEFKLVPIVMGSPTMANCEILSEALVKNIKDKNVLLVASTDMSHYHSYNKASAMDGLTISLLEKFDIDGLYKNLNDGSCELCGAGPVITVMLAAKKLGADKLKVLKYANSGDVSGDKSRVVGYCAAVLTKSKEKEPEKGGEQMLNKEQQEQLLKIARDTLNMYIIAGKRLEFNITDDELNQECGAFVTLHKKGELRGCIGNIIAHQPLWETIRDMAIDSSTSDPRFAPVTKEELDEINIEISVLTKPERVKSVDEIILGTHGVIVRKGFASGVFLPQVATETGWSKEEFLSYLCAHKAGLSADAWKDEDTELHIFSAQVFGEKKE